jgi:hypothetical protein
MLPGCGKRSLSHLRSVYRVTIRSSEVAEVRGADCEQSSMAGKLHLALGMNGAATGTREIGLSSPAVNAAALKSPAALRCDDVSII